MRLLEHQSRKLLKNHGIPFTDYEILDENSDLNDSLKDITFPAVLKAQVPFGKRNKLGGIVFIDSRENAETAVSSLLNKTIRNTVVAQVSIERQVDIEAEFFLGVTWDTAIKMPVALLSAKGGVDIESISSDSFVRHHFDPWKDLLPFEGRAMALQLGIDTGKCVQIGTILSALSKAFLAYDALTIEINPLALTNEGKFVAVDAHVELEDDAFFRLKEKISHLGSIEDTSAGRQPTPLEEKARVIDSIDHRGVAGRVIEFDGDLALIIGGGGASLTVFDAIRKYGGSPANYCEVGGNPTEEKVAALTTLLLGKPGVKKVAVIMNVVNNTRADVMAKGILKGIKDAALVPSEVVAVFRIPGSWEDEAKALLISEGVNVLGREISIDEAAKMAVNEMNYAN